VWAALDPEHFWSPDGYWAMQLSKPNLLYIWPHISMKCNSDEPGRVAGPLWLGRWAGFF
jgi:hypothetical protein